MRQDLPCTLVWRALAAVKAAKRPFTNAVHRAVHTSTSGDVASSEEDVPGDVQSSEGDVALPSS